jgi:retinol-binding protein 3
MSGASNGREVMEVVKWALIAMMIAMPSVLAQEETPAPIVEKALRDTTIDALISKVVAGYVLPENVNRIVQALRSAIRAGQYDHKTPQEFVDIVNATLRSASHDKHLAVFYQPLVSAPQVSTASVEQRERFNYGFGKLERLRGNIGLLEISSFPDLTQQSAETASTVLSLLANFDAIIVDVRRNGGGNDPMMVFVASFFFEPTPVHLNDIYWRDTDQTSQFWTEVFVPGKRSSRQPVFILTSAQTFSSAEDFCYSLQNVKRATVVGETTSGGAHSSRGLQRLSDSFTAVIPVGRSVSPVTKTNWEGVGVVPDVRATADESLAVAHRLALKVLIERETDEQWKQRLQQLVNDLDQSRR